jgi:hypothetical protein
MVGRWGGSAGLATAVVMLLPFQGLGAGQPEARLLVGRAQHTATLLADGQVLAAGGMLGASGEVADSAELFDPATGRSTATGSMASARRDASGVALADGRVLVVGGWGDDAAVYAPEIFDPTTGGFAPLTGILPTDLAAADAVTLGDGRILVRGSAGSSEPWTGAWVLDTTAASSVQVGSIPGWIVPLADGRVLTIERSWHQRPIIALVDPVTGSRQAIDPPATMPGAAVRLADGRILFAGGEDEDGRAMRAAFVFDPGTTTFEPAGPMRTARYAATATLLADGRVLFAGGRTHRARSGPDGTSWALAAAEVFDPTTGTFQRVGPMEKARMDHTATLLPDGHVLVLGGFGPRYGGQTLVEMFDPADGRFHTIPVAEDDSAQVLPPSLPLPSAG